VGLYLAIDSGLLEIYNKSMSVHFKPTTELGKRSAWLIVAFAALLGAFFILVSLGQRGGDTFFSNPMLTVPMILAVASAVAAFINGILSIKKKKERSIAVYLAVTVGLFVIIFALGELIFPH